jgi:hypothetical protein
LGTVKEVRPKAGASVIGGAFSSVNVNTGLRGSWRTWTLKTVPLAGVEAVKILPNTGRGVGSVVNSTDAGDPPFSVKIRAK